VHHGSRVKALYLTAYDVAKTHTSRVRPALEEFTGLTVLAPDRAKSRTPLYMAVPCQQ
jgi:hypothetical protein